jgi:hypothetical protein
MRINILTIFENSGHTDRRGGSKIVKMMLGGNAILGVAEMCVTGRSNPFIRLIQIQI